MIFLVAFFKLKNLFLVKIKKFLFKFWMNYREVAYLGHIGNMVQNFVDPQKNYEKKFFFKFIIIL